MQSPGRRQRPILKAEIWQSLTWAFSFNYEKHFKCLASLDLEPDFGIYSYYASVVAGLSVFQSRVKHFCFQNAGM
jgi:hypothetical protein